MKCFIVTQLQVLQLGVLKWLVFGKDNSVMGKRVDYNTEANNTMTSNIVIGKKIIVRSDR